MFRVLRGLTYAPRGSARPIANAVWAAFGRPDQVADPGFIPRYLSFDSALYESLFAKREMMSLGLDLSKSAASEIANGIATAWPYILLVVGAGSALLRLAAHGCCAGLDQSDDVGRPAEAAAVPAGGLRRVPDLLPRGAGRLLHRPDPCANRPTDLHHALALRDPDRNAVVTAGDDPTELGALLPA